MKHIESNSKKSQVYSKLENNTIYFLKVITDAIEDISKKNGIKNSITTGAAIDLLISESLRGTQGIIEINNKVLGSQQIIRYALDCKINNTKNFISKFLDSTLENEEMLKIETQKNNLLNYINYLENKLSNEEVNEVGYIKNITELKKKEFANLLKKENEIYQKFLSKNIFDKFKLNFDKNIDNPSIPYNSFRKEIFEELSKDQGIYKLLIKSTYRELSWIIDVLNDDICNDDRYITEIGEIELSEDQINNKKNQDECLSVIGDLYNYISTESELIDRFQELIFNSLYDDLIKDSEFNLIIEDKDSNTSDIEIAELLEYKSNEIKELNKKFKSLLDTTIENFCDLLNWSFSTCGVGFWR